MFKVLLLLVVVVESAERGLGGYLRVIFIWEMEHKQAGLRLVLSNFVMDIQRLFPKSGVFRNHHMGII